MDRTFLYAQVLGHLRRAGRRCLVFPCLLRTNYQCIALDSSVSPSPNTGLILPCCLRSTAEAVLYVLVSLLWMTDSISRLIYPLTIRSAIFFCRLCASFTSSFPPVLHIFRMMLFPSRILCLAAPISTILCCTLVTATPRQTAAPVRARQASTDTIEPNTDEDPNVSIDNTDRLRKGMNDTPDDS